MTILYFYYYYYFYEYNTKLPDDYPTHASNIIHAILPQVYTSLSSNSFLFYVFLCVFIYNYSGSENYMKNIK